MFQSIVRKYGKVSAQMTLMGIVWVVKGFLRRPAENKTQQAASRAGGKGRMLYLDGVPTTLAKRYESCSRKT